MGLARGFGPRLGRARPSPWQRALPRAGQSVPAPPPAGSDAPRSPEVDGGADRKRGWQRKQRRRHGERRGRAGCERGGVTRRAGSRGRGHVTGRAPTFDPGPASPRASAPQLRFVLLFSRQGKLRLQQWYRAGAERDKRKAARELMQAVLARKPKMCSFLEWGELKVVYKRWGTERPWRGWGGHGGVHPTPLVVPRGVPAALGPVVAPHSIRPRRIHSSLRCSAPDPRGHAPRDMAAPPTVSRPRPDSSHALPLAPPQLRDHAPFPLTPTLWPRPFY